MRTLRIYGQPIRNGSKEWLREMIDMETEPDVGIEVVAIEYRAQTGARSAPREDRAGDGRDAAASPDAGRCRASERQPEPDEGLPGISIVGRGDLGPPPLLSLSRRQAGS